MPLSFLMPDLRPEKVLVILGHPSRNSLCNGLADAYEEGVRVAEAECRRINLVDLQFDPILHEGYNKIQELEPDLVAAQEAIRWAEHLVFVYPNWWTSMPALMKGFFDRILLPNFAFKYRAEGELWDKYLSGRSARLIVTMDAPPIFYRLVLKAPGHQQMREGVLGFCGIEPVNITEIGPVKHSDEARRGGWIKHVRRLGAQLR